MVLGYSNLNGLRWRKFELLEPFCAWELFLLCEYLALSLLGLNSNAQRPSLTTVAQVASAPQTLYFHTSFTEPISTLNYLVLFICLFDYCDINLIYTF